MSPNSIRRTDRRRRLDAIKAARCFTCRRWKRVAFFSLLCLNILALPLTIAGCKKRQDETTNEPSKLVGTWELTSPTALSEQMLGDTPSMQDDARSTNPSEGRSNQDGEATPGVTLGVTFEADGTLVTESNIMASKSTKIGTWKLIDETSEEVTIRFQIDADPEEQLTIRFSSKDQIRMIPPNIFVLGEAYSFSRATK